MFLCIIYYSSRFEGNLSLKTILVSKKGFICHAVEIELEFLTSIWDENKSCFEGLLCLYCIACELYVEDMLTPSNLDSLQTLSGNF